MDTKKGELVDELLQLLVYANRCSNTSIYILFLLKLDSNLMSCFCPQDAIEILWTESMTLKH